MVGSLIKRAAFAKPIYKYTTKKGMTKRYTPKKRKALDYYEYEGKKYQPKDLILVNKVNPKTKRLRYGYVPKEEAERIAGLNIMSNRPTLEALEKVKKKRQKPSDKTLEAMKKLDALSDEELRYLTEKQAAEMGIPVTSNLGPYRQGRLGTGTTYGVRTKFTDASGKPIYMEKYGDALEALSAENTKIVQDIMSKIN